jgi:hypothetical protein
MMGYGALFGISMILSGAAVTGTMSLLTKAPSTAP